ncbi:erythromycin esterase family protein [Kibdelosporangium phytohabitans]|nr:erythromycin esterase family protein [Kibdelosporangium phytohabitans]MBE1465737.1 erythromycin esterase-like protein [Kibdelosporangium phytohabitans]
MVIEEAGMALAEDVGPAINAFLETRPTSPRVLAMGEPTHWLEALPRLRNRVFQHLVEHHGYRALAIESCCMKGLVANAYVVDGAGTVDEALENGFSHGFGQFDSSRELIEWMRAYNQDHGDDPVRFFGADGPLEITEAASPREAITGLNAFFGSPYEVDDLLGPDERWTNPDAAMDPTQSVGSSDDVRQLRLIADDLRARVVTETPRLVAQSRDDWWLARLYARTANGLLRYHENMAWNSPQRIPRLLAIRDGMMAENLKAVTEYGKTMVAAHNKHLQREKSVWEFADAVQEWWSAGAIVSAELGDQYAFLATAIGTAADYDIGAPAPDTLEGSLSGDCVLESSRIDTTGLRMRDDNDHRWFPIDPAHIKDTDGIVFIKDVPRQSDLASASTRPH